MFDAGVELIALSAVWFAAGMVAEFGSGFLRRKVRAWRDADVSAHRQ